MIELLRIERACVAKADACGRNCAACELVQDGAELLEMYDAVIALLNAHSVTWKKPDFSGHTGGDYPN